MIQDIIELNNVSFKVGDKQILDTISFSVNEGEIVTITGPSGGGKSTLLKLIALIMSPTSGTIKYQGRNIREYEPTEYRKEVSYFFQNATLFEDTVKDNLSFPAKIRDDKFNKQQAREGLEIVQLSDISLEKPIHELSGGEKQRVALIRNLMYPPRVLLMDEVTSSLDKTNREIILSFINEMNKEKDMTIMWITHNQEEINTSDRIITLSGGKMKEFYHGKQLRNQ